MTDVMVTALRRLVEERMLPDQQADLDRGDNELIWQMGREEGAGGRVAFMNRTLRDDPQAAFADASALLDEVQALGWHLEVTSRIAAATATADNQDVLGFRGHVDLRIDDAPFVDQSHLDL